MGSWITSSGVIGDLLIGSRVAGIVVIRSAVTGSRVIKPIKRIPVKKFNLTEKHGDTTPDLAYNEDRLYHLLRKERP
jgi:hypothetical protein